MSQSTRHNLPILSPLSRAIAKDHTVIYYLLVIALTALVIGIQTFGWPVLTLTALASVPVIFVLLIIVTLP
jgi:hypothetical protein